MGVTDAGKGAHEVANELTQAIAGDHDGLDVRHAHQAAEACLRFI